MCVYGGIYKWKKVVARDRAVSPRHRQNTISGTWKPKRRMNVERKVDTKGRTPHGKLKWMIDRKGKNLRMCYRLVKCFYKRYQSECCNIPRDPEIFLLFSFFKNFSFSDCVWDFLIGPCGFFGCLILAKCSFEAPLSNKGRWLKIKGKKKRKEREEKRVVCWWFRRMEYIKFSASEEKDCYRAII